MQEDFPDIEGNEMMKEFHSLVKRLERLGLSSYEARAYIALVVIKKGSADNISRVAKIPRTSAYKVLESLKERGFVQSSGNRPTLYTAEAPEKLSVSIMKEVEGLFDRISFLRDMVEFRGIPQLVYTLTGEESVMEKVAEILDMAERRVIISTPAIGDIRKKLKRKIAGALKRGVEVVIITSPLLKTPPNTTVVRRKGIIATDVVADGKIALLAAPDLSACGYTDDPSLALHLERFLEIMMESGN